MADVQQIPVNQDINGIWENAVARYRKDTKHDLPQEEAEGDASDEVPEFKYKSVNDLFSSQRKTQTEQAEHRKKHQKARNVLKACVEPLALLSDIAKSALGLTPFAPAAVVFGAGMYLINACRNVTEALDAVEKLFEQCGELFERLKIYAKTRIPTYLSQKLTVTVCLALEVFGPCEKIVGQWRVTTWVKGLFQHKQDLLIGYVAQFKEKFEQEEQLNVAQIFTDVSQLRKSQDEDEHKHRREDLIKGIQSIPLGPVRILEKEDEECKKSKYSPPDWILKHETYLEWLNDDTKRWLWGFGNGGTGKTSLVSFLTRRWRESQNASIDTLSSREGMETNDNEQQKPLQTTAIALFYCSYRFSDEQRLDAVLKSLVRQLLETLGKVDMDRAIEHIKDIRELAYDLDGTPLNWTNILDQVAGDFQRTILAVDALDENEAGYLDLIKALDRLKSSNIKLLVTSRDEGSIHRNAQHLKQTVTLTIRASDEFIEFYARKRLERIADPDGTDFQANSALPNVYGHASPERQNEIVRNIRETAEGNFYCAELQITALQAEKSAPAVESILKNLKSGLAQVIRDAVDRINKQSDPDKRELGMKALMWATYARQSLTVEELRHALALTIWHYTREDQNAHQRQVERISESDLISSTRFFLRIENQTVHIHKAIKDYCDQALEFEDAQYVMAETCLSFLGRRFFSLRCSSQPEYEEVKQRHPFYKYAARYWGDHVKRAGEERFLGPSSSVLLASLLNNRLFINCVSVVHRRDLRNVRIWVDDKAKWKVLQDKSQPVFWPVHLLTFLDLQYSVDWWLQRYPNDAYRKSQTGVSPLYLACHLGRTRIVELLLFNYNVDPSAKGAEPSGYNLAAAVFSQSADVVERLLYASPERLVEQTNWHGRRPLAQAAMLGNERITQLIRDAVAVRKDAHTLLISQETNDNCNALHDAIMAKQPSLRTIELLVRQGGEELLNQPTKEWHDTPLHFAARDGRAEAVQLLIDLGAKTAVRQKYGMTPLQLAVAKPFASHEKTIRILLASTEHGLQDYGGVSTWHQAAASGRASVMELLIAYAKENSEKSLFNVRAKDGLTPIRMAIQRRQAAWLGCVEVLLRDCPDEIDPEDAYEVLNVLITQHGPVGYSALKKLLKHRIYPWPLSRGTTTVLHKVIHFGSIEGVEIAWDIHGSAEVAEYHDAAGSTALILASLCFMQWVEKVKFLLKKGANTDAQDHAGRTALHHAIALDRPILAGLLLDAKASTIVKDCNGITALEQASVQNSCCKIWQVRNLKCMSSQHTQHECLRNEQTKKHYVVGHEQTKKELLEQGVSDPVDVSSVIYMRCDPIPPRTKVPILHIDVSVTWQTRSKDGGGVWCDLAVFRNDNMRKRLLLCRPDKTNRPDDETQSHTHQATWHLENGPSGNLGDPMKESDRDRAKEMVRDLRVGDVIALVVLADGKGKVSIMEKAEVKVYYEDFGKANT